jgi:hypothetical protein
MIVASCIVRRTGARSKSSSGRAERDCKRVEPSPPRPPASVHDEFTGSLPERHLAVSVPA